MPTYATIVERLALRRGFFALDNIEFSAKSFRIRVRSEGLRNTPIPFPDQKI